MYITYRLDRISPPPPPKVLQVEMTNYMKDLNTDLPFHTYLLFDIFCQAFVHQVCIIHK